MNQYRCETCKFLVNKNWAGSGDCSNPKLDEPIWMHKSASGYDDGAVVIIAQLGCASHSDFQNQKEKVLEVPLKSLKSVIGLAFSFPQLPEEVRNQLIEVDNFYHKAKEFRQSKDGE
jgi:hypothetical protein